MSKYLAAIHALGKAEVSILRQTKTHLFLQNKYGMNECIENNAESILDYIWAD